jgi:hypothetical protein
MANAGWLLLLILVCWCNGSAVAAGKNATSGSAASLPPTVTLSASIVEDIKHDLALQLSLRNNDVKPVTIATGLIVGSTPYPAADFRFALRLRDQRYFTLFCGSCGPGVIGGRVGVYKATLAPGDLTTTVVSLKDFLNIDEKDQRLCTEATKGAVLIATLRGQQWPYSDPHQVLYWTGIASATVSITCGGK